MDLNGWEISSYDNLERVVILAGVVVADEDDRFDAGVRKPSYLGLEKRPDVARRMRSFEDVAKDDEGVHLVVIVQSPVNGLFERHAEIPCPEREAVSIDLSVCCVVQMRICTNQGSHHWPP